MIPRLLAHASAVAAAFALSACTPVDADPSGGVGGAAASGSSGGGSHVQPGEGLPCDVDAVLEASCRSCHSDPPKYGAPMPLGSIDDVHAPAESDPSRSVYELMLERLLDEKSPMPPGADIGAAERDLLAGWLEDGAPVAEESGCGGQGGAGAGGGPPVGPDALPCKPSHFFTAHAAGSKEAFHVPEQGADNMYQCFTFQSPFDGKTQATAWAPIVDDERVLHHWILYRTQTAQPAEGVMPCAMPGDATFVAGWAPGGQNFVLPENVGLELAGPDDWFILQVHYHNSAHHADALDASGVALCTTDTPREHDAGIVTLGDVTLNIPPHASGHEETGTCPSWVTSYLTEPLHLIASFPHMHGLGTEFETVILREGSDSKVETLVQVDHFSFDDQRYYEHTPPVVLQPGDALRTTCTYDNPSSSPVSFGEKTEDEMCFNFVMVYPVSSLGNNRSCGLF